MDRRLSTGISRRQVIRTAAAGAAVSAVPSFVFGAAPDRPLKIGIIGSGERGTNAGHNAMTADPNVKVVALADAYEGSIKKSRESLAKSAQIDEKNCFVGLDAYKKLLELELDYVILATPPYFRPEHLAACIAAGRHVFMEKPVAVDAPGVRSVLESGQKASDKKLAIVAGTQRRHQLSYVETIKRLHDGAIGRITAGQIYWNGGRAQSYDRKDGWSDRDWMMHDWFNWAWLSGDHIVEQHVHNIDVANWVIGTHPISAVAMGGRHRRPTGDQFDFFATDFTYPNHVHVASQCRQIKDCVTNVSERMVGEKGWSNCTGFISTTGKLELEQRGGKDAYVQEHRNLINAIRTGDLINEAKNVAESTLSAIMARTSAYTGQEVTWDQIMASNEKLGPPDYELTPENIRRHIPVPGKA